MSKYTAKQLRESVTIVLFVVGTILIMISLAAEILGIDLTPGFGIVQMVELLMGLSFITLATFMRMRASRRNQERRSLQADIAVRLAATGLVFAYVSGLSDLIGIGTHVGPNFERPFVGPLQLGGIGLGILSIIAGLFLYHTSRRLRDSSSLDFLSNGEK